MTEQEIEEAKELYRLSKLTPQELSFRENFLLVRDRMETLELEYKNLQQQCPHPLIMRETKNEGSTGGWDRDSDSFWTTHHCKLCDSRWWTNQRWKYIGDGLGLPSNKEACSY